jgi:hypothetical protein
MTKRELLYPELKRLREDEGLIWREIGERIGLSLRTASQYYLDPTGDKIRARKALKDGTCLDCGGRTVSDGGTTPKRCNGCAKVARKVWTRDEIVAAVTRWADTHGGVPPVASDWNTTMARDRGKPERGDEFPVTNTVRTTFGTWNAAIRAAGFDAFEPGHYGREGEDPEVLAECARLYREGWSTCRLADRYGCSPGAVASRLEQAGQPRRSVREAQALRWAA